MAKTYMLKTYHANGSVKHREYSNNMGKLLKKYHWRISAGDTCKPTLWVRVEGSYHQIKDY